MTFTRKAAAVLCIAPVLLGGCSSTSNPSGPQNSDSSASVAPTALSSGEVALPTSCTDPLAGEPTEVNLAELTFCEAEALSDLAGYVIEQYDGDELLSVGRVNINPLAVEMTPGIVVGDDDPDGQIILVGGDTLYRDGGKWRVATLDSTDPNEAYMATLPTRFEVLADPNRRVRIVNPTATLRVVGTDVVDGRETTVLEGTDGGEGTGSSDGTAGAGEPSSTKRWVTDDYLVIRTETTINGRTGRSELSDIDQAQEIRRPKLG